MSRQMEQPQVEKLVKRLFKVAEILSRTPAQVNCPAADGESAGKNHELSEIGYCEADDQFMKT